jgi:uncharacterized repeat protein (TIGR02543 family)
VPDPGYNPGYKFVGWSGDASGTDNPLIITMDSDKTVDANFANGVTVKSIKPDSLGNGKGNRRAHVTISGYFFAPGATAWIVQSGVSTPKKRRARVTSVSLDGKSIECDLNLISADPGDWDVVVTNPDGEFATLTGGLTVNEHPVIDRPTTPFSGKSGPDPVSLTLTGNYFVEDGLKVTLTKGSLLPIDATIDSVTFDTIECHFDLTGAQIGAWRGKVTNQDGGIGEFKFRVTSL